MSKKLMLVTIAGVQEFIAKARKPKDFLNGSKVIVDYLKEIQEILNEKCSSIKDFKVILPEKVSSQNNNPNYFIAKFESDNDEKKIRELLKQKLSDKYKIICKNLNVYIVVVPYQKEYYKVYENLYKKLDYYKNDRFTDYAFYHDSKDKKSEERKKYENCSICEVNDGAWILKGNAKPEKYNGQNIKFDNKEDCEILCDACYKKREYDNENKFQSVIEIGPIEWKKKSGSDIEKYDNEIENLIKRNGTGEIISQYYFPDYLAKNNVDEKYVNELNRFIDYSKGIKPSRYYALVKADIDSLGEHFSGGYLEGKDGLLEFQEKLSRQIGEFGLKLKQELDKLYDTPKLCIYAGGDDILFFCPLYKVFDIIKNIDKYLEEINTGYDKKITMSKSIVISHSTIPLKKIINLSRTSLEIAKEKFKKDNKDAIAISLINSSSTVLTAYLKNREENINSVKYLINGFKKSISKSLIFTMEKQLCLFGEDMTFNEYDALHNVMINVIKKVCDRKISCPSKDKPCKKDYFDKFQKLFYEFIEVNSTNYHIDIKGYFNLLHILDKYSREIIDELIM